MAWRVSGRSWSWVDAHHPAGFDPPDFAIQEGSTLPGSVGAGWQMQADRLKNVFPWGLFRITLFRHGVAETL
jgi:hypothetical protein